MTRRFFKSKKGFTLIELLVVIAIIGVLASIVLASLNTARRKGRDTRRIADLGQVRLALELYFDTGNNRSYPPGNWAAMEGLLEGAAACGNAPCMVNVPADPSTQTYVYQSLLADGTICNAAPCASYVLQVILEDVGNQVYNTDIDGTFATIDCGAANAVAPNDSAYCQRP